MDSDLKKAQSLGKKPSVQQRDGSWGYLHPFNATWHSGFPTRQAAREARNAVKGADQEVEKDNGDIEIVSRAPVPDPPLEPGEEPAQEGAWNHPPTGKPIAADFVKPTVAKSVAAKPEPKWKPTQADVLEVRRCRALGHSFRKIDEDLGWPPANGNRSFRIIKGSWNFEDLAEK